MVSEFFGIPEEVDELFKIDERKYFQVLKHSMVSYLDGMETLKNKETELMKIIDLNCQEKNQSVN